MNGGIGNAFNRTILECKCVFLPYTETNNFPPLIELYQNVNKKSSRDLLTDTSPLIELYQNVNEATAPLIELYQNAFNRTILECKQVQFVFTYYYRRVL